MEFSNHTKLDYKLKGKIDVIDWKEFNKKIEVAKDNGKFGREFRFYILDGEKAVIDQFVITEFMKEKRAYRVVFHGLCVMLYQREIRDANYNTFYNRAKKLGYNSDGEIKQPVNVIKSAK